MFGFEPVRIQARVLGGFVQTMPKPGAGRKVDAEHPSLNPKNYSAIIYLGSCGFCPSIV